MGYNAPQRCTRCRTRRHWSRSGLCRQCQHSLGLMRRNRTCVRPVRGSEAPVKAVHALIATQRQPSSVREAHETRVYGRDVFEVTWTGAMDGAIGMGLPLASERGKPQATDQRRRE